MQGQPRAGCWPAGPCAEARSGSGTRVQPAKCWRSSAGQTPGGAWAGDPQSCDTLPSDLEDTHGTPSALAARSARWRLSSQDAPAWVGRGPRGTCLGDAPLRPGPVSRAGAEGAGGAARAAGRSSAPGSAAGTVALTWLVGPAVSRSAERRAVAPGAGGLPRTGSCLSAFPAVPGLQAVPSGPCSGFYGNQGDIDLKNCFLSTDYYYYHHRCHVVVVIIVTTIILLCLGDRYYMLMWSRIQVSSVAGRF